MAHVVAFGHDSGRGRLRMVAAHGVCFLNVVQQPPPLWVVCVGSRASGSVFGGDGEFTGCSEFYSPYFGELG